MTDSEIFGRRLMLNLMFKVKSHVLEQSNTSLSFRLKNNTHHINQFRMQVRTKCASDGTSQPIYEGVWRPKIRKKKNGPTKSSWPDTVR